jgi:hypothetical protein
LQQKNERLALLRPDHLLQKLKVCSLDRAILRRSNRASVKALVRIFTVGFDSPTDAVQEYGTYGGRWQSRWLP